MFNVTQNVGLNIFFTIIVQEVKVTVVIVMTAI